MLIWSDLLTLTHAVSTLGLLFPKYKHCSDGMAELFAPWARALSNVHVSVLQRKR